jgi:hypothetical protein
MHDQQDAWRDKRVWLISCWACARQPVQRIDPSASAEGAGWKPACTGVSGSPA